MENDNVESSPGDEVSQNEDQTSNTASSAASSILVNTPDSESIGNTPTQFLQTLERGSASRYL